MAQMRTGWLLLGGVWGLMLPACEGGVGPSDGAELGVDEGPAEGEEGGLSIPEPEPEPEPDLYGFAGGCFNIRNDDGRWLTRDEDGGGFTFVHGDAPEATPFVMQAADLATYLLYDEEEGYVALEGGQLVRHTSLRSDLTEQIDGWISDGEWGLEALDTPDRRTYRLRHLGSGKLLAGDEATRDESRAQSLQFVPAQGCAQFPEMSLDAEGTVTVRNLKSGAVWGLVEPHSHIMSNWGFGGGGVFHGAPFHRLGVQHALGDCAHTHGPGGIRDVFGAVYENKLTPEFAFGSVLPDILSGDVQGLLHDTTGYPEFTDWPAAHFSSTHQVQYHKWIERAWMGGLRIMVQHMVTNSIICELTQGLRLQEPRYPCTDMASIDRSIAETYAMQDYIDAQAGGPGKGFFRIVGSPAEARQVIGQGKLAVVLGIETSNLFDCMLNPRPGLPTCDEDYVVTMLDEYHRRGIRALFPNHKFDNAFSGGDGQRDFIEVGNFLNSGHYSNFVSDGCPDVPPGFDKGTVAFERLNEPRDIYDGHAPHNTDRLSRNPVLTLLPVAPRMIPKALEGNVCQKQGLTRLGEHLLREMMKRGMIIEVDHLPRRSYARAFEILEQYDYPAAGTHGRAGPQDKLYRLGGISTVQPGRCRDPQRKGTMLDGMRDRIARKLAQGAYPGEAMTWDLNGFAGAPGPRFGPDSVCGSDQTDPITYPFRSYDGSVTFTQPHVGNRAIDFNTEGLAHIGLLPEFIEDIRKDAESDADLEPLFRSAEAYLRMWEKGERRAQVIRGYGDDDCPFDPYKEEPGLCGCGVEDTDTDGDAIADCDDLCPEDPGKRTAGICGCGTSDADSDADGVPDCNDRCPGDPDLTDTGMCGCGQAQDDTDMDGIADCLDICPHDPDKTEPGMCGCGLGDGDSDGDSTPDCADSCASDPGKVSPGSCGCGTADSDRDGDGAMDCHDLCPDDPGKTTPGGCGCGVPEGRCGLLGSYYHGRDHNELKLKRVDPTINFDWGFGKPDGSMRDSNFSIRWTGTVQAPTSEVYTFYTVADDGVRLWVDDRLIVDDWSDHGARERSGTIALEAGRRYRIRVEYYERHFHSLVRLLWSSGATPKQVVPQSRLVADEP